MESFKGSVFLYFRVSVSKEMRLQKHDDTEIRQSANTTRRFVVSTTLAGGAKSHPERGRAGGGRQSTEEQIRTRAEAPKADKR